MNYVLITPARNEEALIRQSLDSVTSQTLLPVRWVVVDDGSDDQTAEIVEEYAKRFSWIELVRGPAHAERSFAHKAWAFAAGFERVQGLNFEVVGNLDADVSIGADYMSFLMEKFAADPALGVGGTPFIEYCGYDSAIDSFEGEHYVAGGVQLFRADCFRQVGGYVPVRDGGIDWIAVMTARMRGWKVRSFSERRFTHGRQLGTAEVTPLRAAFNYGKLAYSLGSSPIWETFRFLYRMTRKPYVLAGLALGAGYFSSVVRRAQRSVSPELIAFFRHEQMRRLRLILKTMFELKKVDSFKVSGTWLLMLVQLME